MDRAMTKCTLPPPMACIQVCSECPVSEHLLPADPASGPPCVFHSSACSPHAWVPPPPGKMIVVDEEAIQVLQVTAGGAKKAPKLLVKRACMGTRPAAHALFFFAPFPGAMEALYINQ